MSDKEGFLSLLNKYVTGNITAEEEKVFLSLVQEHADDPVLEEALWESYRQSADLEFWTDDYRKAFAGKIIQKIHATEKQEKVTIIPLRRRFPRMAVAAAAAVLVLLAAGAYLWLQFRNVNKDPLAMQTDLPPGKDGAILTLSDGRKMVLDSLGNGMVAKESNAAIILTDGKLSYTPADQTTEKITYNIMSTPKGRQFQLVLPDGSKVWLNAASSIRYPVAFSGKQRMVELEGEAYFEIAPDPQMPFTVKVNEGNEVEVLGTRFNVNAYYNEANIATTLLEGSVRVNAGTQSVILKPRQQARSDRELQRLLREDADINKVLAWKNGYFDFNNEGLQLMMRQLERWYDINVLYEGKIPDIVFQGKMDRNVQLSDVVRFLTMFGIKTRLEERTLIISGS
ncbi:FecR family protein [Pseudoflavitalea rhizosphaerae]|uniref:FecR family protein n=1 Tax=Pseudoflavitalea rhizosphaerae TaxID=1884793 RepID=UPI000F8F3C2D|nr:FecR family protein [Pseudoflavitalea rhizosphaerae]